MLRIGLAVASTWIACGGGGAAGPTVTSEFTDEDAEIFDDGIDFIEDPEGLDGRWQSDWERDLERRVSGADLIAEVEVVTLRLDTDPEQRRTYRLIGRFESIVFGERPDEDIALVVPEGAPGFSSVADNENRLLNERFVVYVKWYHNEEVAGVRPHFHLAPASEVVLDYTRDRATRRGRITQGGTRVIVHEN
jgi:hypothetical protein